MSSVPAGSPGGDPAARACYNRFAARAHENQYFR